MCTINYNTVFFFTGLEMVSNVDLDVVINEFNNLRSNGAIGDSLITII